VIVAVLGVGDNASFRAVAAHFWSVRPARVDILGAVLDLDAVHILLTLAKDGALARTSRTLGLPRTTLTRRIEQLEEQLGMRLVERTPRHLRLTDAGRLLAQQGAPLIDAARQVEATMRASQRYRLRVVLPPGFGWDLIEPILKHDEPTTAELGFELINADHEMHPIRDDVDLVASLVRPTDSSIICSSFLRFSWCCLATPAYLAEHGTPRSAEELAAHSCIAWRIPGGVSPFLWPLWPDSSQQITPWLITNDMHHALVMVLSGRGIGLLPDVLTASAQGLVPVLPDVVGAEGEIFLSMGRRLSDSQRGRRLKEIVDKCRHQLLQSAGRGPAKRRS
jgi:DNA-binding transcriptional LysR family regulator